MNGRHTAQRVCNLAFLGLFLAACGGKTAGYTGEGGANGPAGSSSGENGDSNGAATENDGASMGGMDVPDNEHGREAPPPGVTTTDKVDLLYVVDNSISMADKQQLLRKAEPQVIGELLNPSCVAPSGEQRVSPAPGAPCPDGTKRRFSPVKDLHVGVITSSLGSAGSEVCQDDGQYYGEDAAQYDNYDEQTNDRGHLLGTRPRASGVATNGFGFIEYDGGSSAAQLIDQVQDLISAAGEFGCGFESTLESLYHFLIDPEPHESVVTEPCGGNRSVQCARAAILDTRMNRTH